MDTLSTEWLGDNAIIAKFFSFVNIKEKNYFKFICTPVVLPKKAGGWTENPAQHHGGLFPAFLAEGQKKNA
ncbi:hypothetical protein [Brevibacillus agri]|uniref:hypothetical protein n=1 Tax=Brevibacillus agri TaxID=51101 RepID=UPI0004215EE8|nr:hypothetical protein [Brevibacillus agri]